MTVLLLLMSAGETRAGFRRQQERWMSSSIWRVMVRPGHPTIPGRGSLASAVTTKASVERSGGDNHREQHREASRRVCLQIQYVGTQFR